MPVLYVPKATLRHIQGDLQTVLSPVKPGNQWVGVLSGTLAMLRKKYAGVLGEDCTPGTERPCLGRLLGFAHLVKRTGLSTVAPALRIRLHSHLQFFVEPVPRGRRKRPWDPLLDRRVCGDA